MHAVLRIDLQAVAFVVVFDVLINPRRAVACFWARKFLEIDVDRD